MKLVPAHLAAQDGARRSRRTTTTSTHDHATHERPRRRASRGHGAGIEWEDDMVEVNRMTTPANMRWKLVDRRHRRGEPRDRLAFRVGDRVKIRLVNEMDSDHPMHHPFHVHGAGRFLVLARDGVAEANLVWKDTVLVRTGETVDILLDVTNPGRWMAHCHIAEHHESGMMFSFDVVPADAARDVHMGRAARNRAEAAPDVRSPPWGCCARVTIATRARASSRSANSGTSTPLAGSSTTSSASARRPRGGPAERARRPGLAARGDRGDGGPPRLLLRARGRGGRSGGARRRVPAPVAEATDESPAA